MAFDNIAKSLFVANQLPVDAKTYFNTTTEMVNLGAGNYKAFQYYAWMKVFCLELESYFIWKEVGPDGSGLLADNFVYPANSITEGIDYSGKHYNFVSENTSSSDALVATTTVIYKNPNNDINRKYLEVNDIAQGFFSPTKFGSRIYLGGPVIEDSSWKKIDEFNPEDFLL